MRINNAWVLELNYMSFDKGSVTGSIVPGHYPSQQHGIGTRDINSEVEYAVNYRVNPFAYLTV